MSGAVRSLAVLVLVTLPLSASAHGLRPVAPRAVVHYYAAPVVWMPAYRVGVYAPLPVVVPPVPCLPTVPAPVPALTYPAPVPAPAPASPVLPVMPKIPEVSESHAPAAPYFDTYPVAPREGERPGDTPAVRVWNLSGQDLTIRVDGTTQAVPSGQSVRLSVARQFVWQVVGREPQAGRIPETQAGLEIIVRR
jgi:hypothetical protein